MRTIDLELIEDEHRIVILLKLGLLGDVLPIHWAAGIIFDPTHETLLAEGVSAVESNR